MTQYQATAALELQIKVIQVVMDLIALQITEPVLEAEQELLVATQHLQQEETVEMELPHLLQVLL